MTNLLATITFVVLTNWTTTSIESPVRPAQPPGINSMTLEYYATGYHETGVILSNTIATLQWKEKRIPVVLESVQLGTITRVNWR